MSEPTRQALLLRGRLPEAAEAREYAGLIATYRQVPAAVLDALPALVRGAPEATPMELLPAALVLFGAATALHPVLDDTEDQRERAALHTASAVPVLLAALHRLRTGADPIPPRTDLGHTADYLHMVTGTEPNAEHANSIEQYLIATVEHGFNASTFTARVVASTGASMPSAVTAALGALGGPLHGGAPGRALETLEAIGSPEHTETDVRRELAHGRRIMGFGHAVYRTDDPRSTLLRHRAIRLAESAAERGDADAARLVERAAEVERRVLAVLAEHKPDRPLKTNVEYYAGVVMHLVGLPDPMLTPTFATGRVIGWSAHIVEQARERKIIRPAARYVGPPPLVDVPAP